MAYNRGLAPIDKCIVMLFIASRKHQRPYIFLFFFSLDGKETKDQARPANGYLALPFGRALPARRPFTALFAKTAELIALEQPPFWSLTSA